MSVVTDAWVGKVIAEKYLIIRLLGRGGMGAVYEGRDQVLDRQVAIKMLQAEIAQDKVAVARFMREAKASAKLNHRNAITIHDFGPLPEGNAFIVMEFIQGDSMRKFLRRGALPLTEALELFIPICEAVAAAHQMGIVHRDLKPENIMLKESHDNVIIKVVDFGLAKLQSEDQDSQPRLTKTGEVMGTPQYIAPEIFDGEPADARADIYALGIIFYEMITGNPPFTGSFESVIAGHVLKDPKPPSQVKPEISKEIDEILAHALKKKREDRIQSALDLAESLKKAIIKPLETAQNLPTPQTDQLSSLKTDLLASTPQTEYLSNSQTRTSLPPTPSKALPTLKSLDDAPNSSSGNIVESPSSAAETQKLGHNTINIANSMRNIDAAEPTHSLSGRQTTNLTSNLFDTNPNGDSQMDITASGSRPTPKTSEARQTLISQNSSTQLNSAISAMDQERMGQGNGGDLKGSSLARLWPVAIVAPIVLVIVAYGIWNIRTNNAPTVASTPTVTSTPIIKNSPVNSSPSTNSSSVSTTDTEKTGSQPAPKTAYNDNDRDKESSTRTDIESNRADEPPVPSTRKINRPRREAGAERSSQESGGVFGLFRKTKKSVIDTFKGDKRDKKDRRR